MARSLCRFLLAYLLLLLLLLLNGYPYIALNIRRVTSSSMPPLGAGVVKVTYITIVSTDTVFR